ncbi:MAG: sigma-70 family RNA polymerase sigma factor [Deltaproteobacteria bacterium]|nr:sigma-70 family RNA polymerase sigma factor [Deltaproteobacteria bacterium]
MKQRPKQEPGDGSPTRGEVTALLADLRRGRREAMDELLPLIYHDLRSLARRQLRGQRPGHTLNTTALAHEAFLKLADGGGEGWQNRTHFMAVAATAMRHILVDAARQRLAQKRGGGAFHVPLDEVQVRIDARALEVLDLDAALEKLTLLDPRQARVIELHFYGGMTFEEVAEVMEISTPTAKRDWRKARAFLHFTLARRSDAA